MRSAFLPDCSFVYCHRLQCDLSDAEQARLQDQLTHLEQCKLAHGQWLSHLREAENARLTAEMERATAARELRVARTRLMQVEDEVKRKAMEVLHMDTMLTVVHVSESE